MDRRSAPADEKLGEIIARNGRALIAVGEADTLAGSCLAFVRG
jgi:hypothetical protein